jgi:hypothetical protein
MSYGPYFSSAAFRFPTGAVGLVAALTYLNTLWSDKPGMGLKEVSIAEYNATPTVGPSAGHAMGGAAIMGPLERADAAIARA